MNSNINIINKIRNYCAIQERCSEEIRSKMAAMGLSEENINANINLLIKEGFINDQRFAIQYASGKFRLKQWGRIKITAGLQSRGITENLINEALGEIDEDDYLRTIMSLIEKEKSRKGDLEIVNLLKSKGFEEDIVLELLENQINKNISYIRRNISPYSAGRFHKSA